jgi:hypothetical protein
MRKSSTWIAAVLVGAAALAARTAAACGDKFVVLGRSVRAELMRRSAHPASILLYNNPASRIPTAEKEYRLASMLKQAGHKILVLQDQVQLDEALTSRGFDIVLTDYTDSSSVDQMARAASPDTVVIPVLYKPSAAELAEAEKQFGCVVRTSKKDDDVLAVVDEAMSSRGKGLAVRCPKPK